MLYQNQLQNGIIFMLILIPIDFTCSRKRKIPEFWKKSGINIVLLFKRWCHQESNLLLWFILIPWVTARLLLYLLWKPLN